MIRVLHCFGSLNRGGIQSFIMNLYRNIDRNEIQFDFLLVSSSTKGDYYDEVTSLGGRCFYITPRNVNPVKNRKEIKTFFHDHLEYSILHYHMSSCSYWDPIIYAHKYGVNKIIMHAHSTRQTGNAFHWFLHMLHRRRCLNYSTNYFACSDKAAKWLFGSRKQVKIINNCINCDEYIYNESIRKEVRDEFGIRESYVLIGHVGRFVEPKNHSFLLKVFQEYHLQHPNSKLMLVGDGVLREKISEEVQSFGLEDSVIMTGMRKDIPRLLQGFDIFLMPSIFEGFPVTLIEAQASGLPCVVSDRITKQAKVIKEVEYISLDEPVNKWCMVLNDWLNNVRRYDTSSEIKEAGFDSNSVALELSEFYQD